MRCEKCGVDLGEEYTLCPLCGEKAVNEEPILKGFKTAGYLKYNEADANTKPRFGHDLPLKVLLRSAWIICPVFGIISLFAARGLWTFGVPAVFAVLGVTYFLCGIFEKGRLLHNGVELLASAASGGIFTLVAVISKCGAMQHSIAFGFVCVLFLVLFAVKPKRMTEQLKALFVL